MSTAADSAHDPTYRPTGSTSTPDLLREATDQAGQSAEAWLADVLTEADGLGLDICRAPTDPAGKVTLRRIGSHAVAFARPERLPIAHNALAQARIIMCLPALGPLDSLFAELRRVLRPTGTLAALVPSRPRGSLAELRAWWPLNRALAGHARFRNESARDKLSWLFTAADFAVLTDQRRTFWWPVPDTVSAEGVVTGLVTAGVLPPDVSPERLRLASAALARSAAPSRRMPIPLRIVLGRR